MFIHPPKLKLVDITLVKLLFGPIYSINFITVKSTPPLISVKITNEMLTCISRELQKYQIQWLNQLLEFLFLSWSRLYVLTAPCGLAEQLRATIVTTIIYLSCCWFFFFLLSFSNPPMNVYAKIHYFLSVLYSYLMKCLIGI